MQRTFADSGWQFRLLLQGQCPPSTRHSHQSQNISGPVCQVMKRTYYQSEITPPSGSWSAHSCEWAVSRKD